MNYLELNEKREALKGTEIIRMLQHLSVTHYSYNTNYKELMSFANKMELDLDLFDIEVKNKINMMLYDFSRLLLNYVGSTSVYIDHVRQVKNKLGHESLNNEFKLALDKLLRNEVIIFLKDLRNYTIHETLPLVGITTTISNEDGKQVQSQNLNISKESIIQSQYWSKSSIAFLEKQEENILIKEIIENYHNLFNGFQENFYKATAHHFDKEIKELIALEKVIYEWISKNAPQNMSKKQPF